MRKFRFVGDNSFYGTDFVLNQVYGGDVQKDCWRCVEDLAEICPKYWEEVFEETKPVRKFRLVNGVGYTSFKVGSVYDETVKFGMQGYSLKEVLENFPQDWEEVFEDDTLEDRVNEIEMSYVGAEHFEEVVGMLDEKIKVLEGLIVRGESKSEQKLLPQKYQLIEVRDDCDYDGGNIWRIRAYLHPCKSGEGVVCVDVTHLECVLNSYGVNIDPNKYCSWEKWRFIKD